MLLYFLLPATMVPTIEGSVQMTVSRVAFASDYDGTLVHPGNMMQPSDVDSIHAFQAMGGLFGACSGRALNAVLGPAEKAGLSLDFAVASSGALIVLNGHVVEEHPVGREVVRKLVSEFHGAWMALHTGARLLVETDPTTPYQTKVPSLNLPTDEAIYSVSINFGDPALAAQAVRSIERRLGDLVKPFQNVGSVDVVACGCSKGRGIEVVREALDTRVTAGIGDSYNDVPLLDAVDLPYTFHASPKDVQSHAKVLVDTVGEAVIDFTTHLGWKSEDWPCRTLGLGVESSDA